MSSQIKIPQGLVPKILCQKVSCLEKEQKSIKKKQEDREIFICNLQKGIEDEFVTKCKRCINTKGKNQTKDCMINLENLYLVLKNQNQLEKEILINLEELEKKLNILVEKVNQEVFRVQSNIKEIGQTIRRMILIQQESDIQMCLNGKQQATREQLIKMIKELREKIIIVSENQELNQDQLNIIYDKGTIIIDDFLQNKLAQMSSKFHSFEKLVSQINENEFYDNQIQYEQLKQNYIEIGKIQKIDCRKIYNLRFNRSNNLFAIGSSFLDEQKSQCVKIWKIDTNIVEIAVLQQYPDVTALCFNVKDDSLFTGGSDSKLIYWQVQQDGKYEDRNLGSEIKGKINCIEINQNSKVLVVGSEELNIFINDGQNWEISNKFENLEVKSIAFSNCNQIIIAYCFINQQYVVQLYQIQKTGKISIIQNLTESISSLQIQPIQKTKFIFNNQKNEISIFCLDNNGIQQINDDSILKLNQIYKRCIDNNITKDNTILLAFTKQVNNNYQTHILKINEQNQVFQFQFLQQKAQKLFFSNNGQLLVIWDNDSLIVLKDSSKQD
ncbi:unnamed protein product [Paramecium sonneborni]|uniref:WD40-repeat-containing domain n=1 Tax=Paramecium sonneborni TaxID=65129 RepID=A0A8S1MWV7_9CILI|nr:unnamed protein product [Paramecium sonneborni]